MKITLSIQMVQLKKIWVYLDQILEVHMSEKTIMLIEPIYTIRQRLKIALEHAHYKVIEASTYDEMILGLKSRQHPIDLLVIDFELRDLQGNRGIHWLKSNRINKPIIVLSGDNRRTTIFEAIQNGASDIIIRPFDESIIVQKIDKLLLSELIRPMNEIIFNIPELIEKECIKAKKGNYVFSLGLATFVNPTESNSPHNEMAHYRLSSKLLPELSALFFETDYFFQFGSQSFIGLFLFCDALHLKIIEDKMHTAYKHLANQQPIFEDYRFVTTFTTFPTDYETLLDYSQLIPDISNKLKEQLDTFGVSK